MGHEVTDMSKKNISGFIRPVRVFAKYFVNKHCAAVIFCFFPFFGEAIAFELGELSSRNVKSLYEVTHGSGILVSPVPSNVSWLEHSHCCIEFVPESLGGCEVSGFSGKAFSQPVFEKALPEIKDSGTSSGAGEKSEPPIHTFLLGFLVGAILMLVVPRVVIIGKHNLM